MTDRQQICNDVLSLLDQFDMGHIERGDVFALTMSLRSNPKFVWGLKAANQCANALVDELGTRRDEGKVK
jgi:hypothetical protein